MTAMIIMVVGVSIAALPTAEAGPINTSRSNIKSLVVQQEGEVTCINQVDGQGDKKAIANPDQTQATGQGDAQATFNPDPSRSGDFTQGDTEITVDADQSTDRSFEQNQTIDLDAEGPNSCTIETTE